MIRRKPARLLDRVSARPAGNGCRHHSEDQSPYLLDVFARSIRSLRVDIDSEALTKSNEMSSRSWKLQDYVSETSESSNSADSMPSDEARARSPAATPPCSDEPPQQGEEGPIQGEEMVAEEEEVVDEGSSEVKGSLSGDGSGEAMAQPLADVSRSVGDLGIDTEAGASGGINVHEEDVAMGEASSRSGTALEREPVYKKQPCRLCNRGMIYITRSGLSNHAVVHHGCWYSAHRDEFVPIPEAELEEKRRAVREGQAHLRRRPDPSHRQEQASSAGSRKRPFSGTQTPQHKKFGEFVIPKLTPCRQDVRMESTGRETRRPVMYAESRPR